MTRPSYTLFCEYIHCCGRKTLKLGETMDETKAMEWAREKNRDKVRPALPPEDLIKTCPVRHCPAKLQVPRFDYEMSPGL